MLAVGGQLDCLVQVGVPGRGRARGSCWSQPLPLCSQAAWWGSAAGLCPSPALGRGGNPPGEDPLGPVEKTCVRRMSSGSSDTKHCSKYNHERKLYLSGPPSLVSLVILQPDDHGAVDRLDGNFSLWQGVLEPVPIVVLQGRYNNLINAI